MIDAPRETRRETYPHGCAFRYVSLVSDVLGWVLENVGGEKFSALSPARTQRRPRSLSRSRRLARVHTLHGPRVLGDTRFTMLFSQRSLLVLCGLGLALPLAPADSARAEPWVLLGARYQGMGGAGVATVNDSTASYWNPGALGFDELYDVRIPFSAQASIEGGVVETMDDIFDLADRTEDALDRIEDGDFLTDEDVEDMMGIVDLFGELDTSGEGFLVGGDLSLIGRLNRIAVGQLFIASSAVAPIKDDINLSLSSDPSGPARVFDAVQGGADHSTGSALQFSQSSSQSLADSIAATAPNFSQNQAEELVYNAEGGGVDTSDEDSREIIQQTAVATGTPGVGDISLNETGAAIKGIITSETGISYGYPFELPYLGPIAVGGNAKIIVGTTFATFIAYNEVDSVGDVISDLFGAPNSKTSTRFGLDLGVMSRPKDWLRLGLVARNVNSPSFKLEGPGDYKLDPQVRAGIALLPLPRWVIALDVDLTENDTQAIPGFKSRQIGIGTEYVIPVWKVAFALRMGGWSNLAGDVNDDFAWTGGLGFRAGRFEANVAAGASLKTKEIENSGRDEWPTRMNLSFSVAWTTKF